MARLPTKAARARNKEIKALYAENILTGSEIASRYGVSQDWVRRISFHVPRVPRSRTERNALRAKRALPLIGAKSRKRDKLVAPHVSKAADLYAKGEGSYSVIAKKLRISRNAVAGAVHRAKGLS